MMLHREPRSAPAATTTADMEIHLAEFYPRLVPRRRDPENGTSAAAAEKAKIGNGLHWAS